MREQARAHRGYLAWTALFTAITVALAGFVAITATQQMRLERHAIDTFGLGGEWSRTLVVGADYDGLDNAVSWEELGSTLDAADAEGAQTAAMQTLDLLALRAVDVDATPDEALSTWWGERGLVGVRGVVDWEAVLLSGAAPRPGGVAVDADWAASLGLGIGDRVDVVVDVWDGDVQTTTDLTRLTVAGLLRPSGHGRYDLSLPVAVLDWDDALASRAGAADLLDVGADDGLADIGAVHATAALDAIPGWPGRPWFGATNEVVLPSVLLLAAMLLATGMIGMAFAAGRAQAQSRSHWVATARALGARRSTLAWAAVAEAAAVGMVAGLAGLGAAWALAALDWSAFAAANADALLPAGPVPARWVLCGALALATALSTIVGAIPAFWAMRITPASALKPVAPLTTSPPRRRLRLGWLILVWVPALGYSAYQGRLYYELPLEGFRWPWLVFPLTGALTLAVAATYARRVVDRASRRLAASARPWALSAAHALVSRPRQAAGPATVFALVASAFGWFITQQALINWAQYGSGIPSWLPEPLRSDAMVAPTGWDGRPLYALAALVFALLTAVAFGTAIAGSAAHRGDRQARTAMGLSHGAARLAGAVEFALPLAVGTLAGITVGFVAAVGAFGGSTPDTSFGLSQASGAFTDVGPLWALVHASHALLPAVMMTGIAIGWISLGAAALAATVRARATVTA